MLEQCVARGMNPLRMKQVCSVECTEWPVSMESRIVVNFSSDILH